MVWAAGEEPEEEEDAERETLEAMASKLGVDASTGVVHRREVAVGAGWKPARGNGGRLASTRERSPRYQSLVHFAQRLTLTPLKV